jgi:hypothetical protein
MKINGYFCNERQIYAMTTILDLGDIIHIRNSSLIDIYAGENKSIDLSNDSDEFGVYLSKAETPMPVIIFRRIEIIGIEGEFTGKKVMLR